jgi:hypothetical protein
MRVLVLLSVVALLAVTLCTTPLGVQAEKHLSQRRLRTLQQVMQRTDPPTPSQESPTEPSKSGGDDDTSKTKSGGKTAGVSKALFSGNGLNGLALASDKIAVPSFCAALKGKTLKMKYSANTPFMKHHSLMVWLSGDCYILELGGTRQTDGSLGAPLKTYARGKKCNWPALIECKKEVKIDELCSIIAAAGAKFAKKGPYALRTHNCQDYVDYIQTGLSLKGCPMRVKDKVKAAVVPGAL